MYYGDTSPNVGKSGSRTSWPRGVKREEGDALIRGAVQQGLAIAELKNGRVATSFVVKRRSKSSCLAGGIGLAA
jgi:hypothetical protein